MEKYSAKKGKGFNLIFATTILYNLLFAILFYLMNSYELAMLLKVTFVGVNLYQLYCLLLTVTLVYSVDENFITISGVFGLKKVMIPLADVQGYKKHSGVIRGVTIYGYGKHHFNLGRSLIEKIGVTSMYVTNSDNAIYLKTEDMNYGISPEDFQGFESMLENHGVKELDWNFVMRKKFNLYKDKKFFVPFMITSIVALAIALIPFIMYLVHKLPAVMPLSFDAQFNPVKMGNGKQFASKQMIYGVLNMAILFCMYYASHFYTKYNRKSTYRLIYIAMAVALIFLGMQLRILITYR